jgi:hypothetical protein
MKQPRGKTAPRKRHSRGIQPAVFAQSGAD